MLVSFQEKSIFYAPKLDVYLTTEEDKKLRTEFSFVADVLRKAGYETPVLFEDATFWIYSDDNMFRSFRSAANLMLTFMRKLPTKGQKIAGRTGCTGRQVRITRAVCAATAAPSSSRTWPRARSQAVTKTNGTGPPNRSSSASERKCDT